VKKFILSAAVGIVLTLPLGGIAAAASDNHVAPGTPGDKNCAGQTYAYLAQLVKNSDPDGELGLQPGIGNLDGVDASLTPQEVKAIVAAYCAGE
jgi:hypothetical protein